MIELVNFSKNYSHYKAVKNLSYKFEKGLITGILGPNGAGKTTLLKALTARHFASEGKVLLESQKYGKIIDAQENPEAVRDITGFVEETPSIPEEYTVLEYLGFICSLHNCSKKNIEKTIELCSLDEVKNKKIRTLSKGYKERVNFAQALVYDSEVLVLDEPASGLDPSQIVKMRSLVKELSKNHTIILSTHLMQEAISLCDRVIILNHGKALISGTIDQICSKTECSSLEEAFFKLTSSHDKNGEDDEALPL
jgi:ABC-2 type transport system ATP-binding protein